MRFFLNPSLKTYDDHYRGKELEVNNWKLSAFIIKKLVPVVGIHPFPLNELQLMTSAVAAIKPTHIFEWGTHTGKSARVFSETCSYLKLDTAIHSVDLPDDEEHNEHPHNKRGKYVKRKKNVYLHQGDGVDTALKIYSDLNNCKPLFYIDGDHSYESVSKELDLILQKVKAPAILLHDTFYQTAESGYNIGPFEAIETVLKKYPHLSFKKIATATGLPGMTFLYTT
jgi:cephalosporin hydroxylase